MNGEQGRARFGAKAPRFERLKDGVSQFNIYTAPQYLLLLVMKR
jgi:hypothetical protein